MPVFQYNNPYTDTTISHGSSFDDDLDFGSDIFDEEMQEIIQEVNALDVPGIRRELADATIQILERTWKVWQK